MDDFYSRTGILTGENGIERLKNSSVMICGIGGVGSYAAEAVARAGVGRITLVDCDIVSVSNINRQIHADHSTVGSFKTAAMSERIKNINPACEVETKDIFITQLNAQNLFMVLKFDYIIDAMDNVTAKIAIITEAFFHGVPIISAMGAANRLRSDMFEITDVFKTDRCPLAKVMRKELKKRGITGLLCCYSREAPMKIKSAGKNGLGSVSFVPAAAGLLIAGHVVRELAGLGLR